MCVLVKKPVGNEKISGACRVGWIKLNAKAQLKYTLI